MATFGRWLVNKDFTRDFKVKRMLRFYHDITFLARLGHIEVYYDDLCCLYAVKTED